MFMNQLKTTMLLAVLTALLLWVGSLWSTAGLIVAGIFVILLNGLAFFFSDKIILWMYKAKEIKEKEDPTYYHIVRDLAKRANLPMPKVYVIPTMTPNAFATGRNPKHGAVACTEGILQLLSKEELTGVLAHELSHIKNRDTLITAVAGMIAGVISYVAVMARWGAIFGMGGDRDNRSGLIQLILIGILAPIIALILQTAISRAREYLADEGAAKLTKDPKGLITALRKIEDGVKHKPLTFGNAATSSQFIIQPFRGQALLQLFSTHPSTQKRIQRLEALKV